MNRLRIVGLTCPGAVQEHLLRRISGRHDLVGWLTMSQPPSVTQRAINAFYRYCNPQRLVQHWEARKFCQAQEAVASGLFNRLFSNSADAPELPTTLPRMQTSDVNAPDAVNFVLSKRPNCLVVSGTNLLRTPYLNESQRTGLKILNVHTGLSPYSRGGNCNLFCILHGQPQMVGVTVHQIDAGIDSGAIIYTSRPRFELTDNFESLEHKVCRLGEDLFLLALEKLSADRLRLTPQWTAGRLFLRRTGYLYEPAQRVLANRMLGPGGLIQQYLMNRTAYDESVRTCEPDEPASTWRHAEV